MGKGLATPYASPKQVDAVVVPPPLPVVKRKDVRNRLTTPLRMTYIVLAVPLDQSGTEIWRISTSCRAFSILQRVKTAWGIPIDATIIQAKIGSIYYTCQPCSCNIIDCVPLSRLMADEVALAQLRPLVQPILLYRYLMGLNLSLQHVYLRYNDEGQAVGLFSQNEARPYKLTGKQVVMIPEQPATKGVRGCFSKKAMKQWFPGTTLAAALRQWWQIDQSNYEEKMNQVYVLLATLTEDMPEYNILADLVRIRLLQLLLP